MKKLMFAVEDVKAEVFSDPFCAVTRGVAVRAFADACRDPNSTVGKYPGDSRLTLVGVYDDVKGVVEPCERETFGFGTEYLAAGGTPIGVANGKERVA